MPNDPLSEATLQQWLHKATDKHVPPAYRTQGITANRLAQVVEALRATRQELANAQTMESAQKQLSNELADRLSKANERIAELDE